MWDWLDSFANSLGDAAASIIAALQFLFALLVAVANFLYALIKAVFDFLVNILKKVATFLHTLWTSFFKKIFTDVINALRKLHSWLELHLGPFIKWLQQARAYFDRIFRLYIKPMLNLIQHVRQYLQILRLLGVKWAGVLDARLGQIEGRIAGIFLQVRGLLTGFIDLANILADPLNLFRRPTAVLSIRRILPTMVKVATGLPMGYFLPSPRSNAPLGLGFMPDNFDPNNPLMNPPASSYFAFDDGLGPFNGFANGDVPPDSAVDDLTLLDYFDDGLYPPAACDDLLTCIQQMVQQSTTAVPKAGT
jgi:hypothetical protein